LVEAAKVKDQRLKGPDPLYTPDSTPAGTPGLSEPNQAAEIERLLERIREHEHSPADPHREKIRRIQKAIADGTYKVSDVELARKIIDDLLGPESY
jgi:hypothetical protein